MSMGMMGEIRFGNAVLPKSENKGVLKKDNDGYYNILVGALESFNSAGEYYSAEGAKALFEESGLLMRRLKNGKLRGEYKHPMPKPGESEKAFLRRSLSIDDDRVSTFFREIYLDFDNCFDENGKKVIGIRAWLKPYGPYGKCVADAIDDPHQNLCYSIRAYTKDRMVGGRCVRMLSTVVTWDQVGEQGIGVANKYSTPALENEKIEAPENFGSLLVTPEMIAGYAKTESKESSILAMENGNLTFSDLARAMGMDLRGRAGFTNW